MKALITGFEPFGGEKTNPAYEAIKRMSNEIGDCKIVKLEVPTCCRKRLSANDPIL